MKLCHAVTVRVFSKPEEDDAQVLSTLASLFPFDLSTEKIPVTTTKATGADEKRIILIHEVTLDKDRHINDFLKHKSSHLSEEQKTMLLRQEKYLDSQLNFTFRLDKHKLHEGIYWITDGGDCYYLRLCIAAYPKKKEACKTILTAIFGQQ